MNLNVNYRVVSQLVQASKILHLKRGYPSKWCFHKLGLKPPCTGQKPLRPIAEIPPMSCSVFQVEQREDHVKLHVVFAKIVFQEVPLGGSRGGLARNWAASPQGDIGRWPYPGWMDGPEPVFWKPGSGQTETPTKNGSFQIHRSWTYWKCHVSWSVLFTEASTWDLIRVPFLDPLGIKLGNGQFPLLEILMGKSWKIDEHRCKISSANQRILHCHGWWPGGKPQVLSLQKALDAATGQISHAVLPPPTAVLKECLRARKTIYPVACQSVYSVYPYAPCMVDLPTQLGDFFSGKCW